MALSQSKLAKKRAAKKAKRKGKTYQAPEQYIKRAPVSDQTVLAL